MTVAANAPLTRVATIDDADAIATTFTEAARAAWRHFVPPERLDALLPDREGWRARLRAPAEGAVVLVAVVGNDVVGFIATQAAKNTGEVETFYTRPRVWGTGVGRALLDAGLEVLRAAGCKDALLWTEERNHRPRRVYEAYGWRVDGAPRERSYLDAPIREVRYRLKL